MTSKIERIWYSFYWHTARQLKEYNPCIYPKSHIKKLADTTQLCDLSLKGIFFCTKKLKFNQAGIFNKCVPIYE